MSAVEVAAPVEYRPYSRPNGSPAGDLYTGIAVFDGTQWASLCWELDIASVGSSAVEALENLREAVQQSVEYAKETGRPLAGPPVPDSDMRDFMLSNKGGASAIGWKFEA